jgi:hypothetical protein
LTQTQRLSITPSFGIKGGSLTYTLDTDTMMVGYFGTVLVGMLFFVKPINFSGSKKIEEVDVLSSTYQKLGDGVTTDFADLMVVSLEPTELSFVLKAGSTGFAVVDTTSQYIKVISANAKVQAMGMTLNVALVPSVSRY